LALIRKPLSPCELSAARKDTVVPLGATSVPGTTGGFIVAGKFGGR